MRKPITNTAPDESKNVFGDLIVIVLLRRRKTTSTRDSVWQSTRFNSEVYLLSSVKSAWEWQKRRSRKTSWICNAKLVSSIERVESDKVKDDYKLHLTNFAVSTNKISSNELAFCSKKLRSKPKSMDEKILMEIFWWKMRTEQTAFDKNSSMILKISNRA